MTRNFEIVPDTNYSVALMLHRPALDDIVHVSPHPDT